MIGISPRSTRAIVVLVATSASTAAALATLGPHAAVIAFLAVLMLGTFATVPNDLRPGEYDLFGLAVLAAVIVIGVGAERFSRKPAVQYTSAMDICGKSGCADDR